MTATDDTCSLASHLAGWVAGTRQCSVPATPTMLRMSIHAMHVAAGSSPASLTTPRCAYDRHRRVVPKGYAAPPRARPFAAPDEPPQLSYPVPGVGHPHGPRTRREARCPTGCTSRLGGPPALFASTRGLTSGPTRPLPQTKTPSRPLSL